MESFFFSIINDVHLEKKVWYRFLRVVNILLYILIVLISIGLAFGLWSSTTQVGGTLVCKDGTYWDVMKDGVEMLPMDKCGMCTKRSADDKTYESCNYTDDSDRLYTSYNVVDRQYKHNFQNWMILLYPFLTLIILLGLLKILLNAIVYIIAGKQIPLKTKEN